MWLWIVLGVVVLAAVWLIFIFRALIKFRQMVIDEFKEYIQRECWGTEVIGYEGSLRNPDMFTLMLPQKKRGRLYFRDLIDELNSADPPTLLIRIPYYRKFAQEHLHPALPPYTNPGCKLLSPEELDRRDQLFVKIWDQHKKLEEVNSEHLPVVTLDDLFEGNPVEQSIGVNQWGHGRPSLSEMFMAFQKVRARDDVQTVLVGISEFSVLDPDEWPYAELVYIITSANPDEFEELAEHMQAEMAGDGWVYGGPNHPTAPVIESGMKIWAFVWD